MNRTTKLPSRVQHKAAHPNLGDVTIATAFENYQDVNGLKLPSKYVTTIDEYPQLTIDVTANHINVDAPNLAAPDTVKAAAAPAPAVPVVEVEPVGTGIWWLAGSGNHRSIVFTRMCHETGCWCKPTSMTAPGDATFGRKGGPRSGDSLRTPAGIRRLSPDLPSPDLPLRGWKARTDYVYERVGAGYDFRRRRGNIAPRDLKEKQMMKIRISMAMAAVCAVALASTLLFAQDNSAREKDRAEIEELMWRYTRALDTGDGTTYAATYTVDGEFSAGGNPTKGRDALKKMVDALKPAAGTPPRPPLYHMETNSWIEFIDKDHARHHAYYLTVSGADGANTPPRIAAAGRSVDHLERVNGKWLIKLRDVSPRD